ncbi:MAG: WbqC family protein [Verrucomicrobiaceae bacterium]|jgi:hypothetical protein|nr:WbqC family protein [Verrucomicrobiaceae bacterium]
MSDDTRVDPPKKRIAVMQSNYIPWKGYFDLMNAVDEFVIYDEVQYTKNDWRNRNRIKTAHGVQWLTIPVRQERLSQRISETELAMQTWSRKHWKTIEQAYSKAPCFDEYGAAIASLYEQASSFRFLSEVNLHFINGLAQLIGITPKVTASTAYPGGSDKNSRLVSIIKAANAGIYLSGPAAKCYLDEDMFAGEGIDVCWVDYRNYPLYIQQYPPFAHDVTALDLLFAMGSKAKDFLKSNPDWRSLCEARQ